MGLVILGAMALYLLVSILVVTGAVKYARTNGKSAARWGWGAALVMYLLVFWDHIPTILAHKYYCDKEAGFWVYKTPEQWKKENPGVMETLVANKEAPFEIKGVEPNYTNTTFLNQRFNWVVKYFGQSFPNQWRHEQEVVDGKTGEVLARYIDFSTAQGKYGGGWYGWKFWLRSEHCSTGGQNQDALRNFRNNFMGVEK